jgi:hypothetical protein
MSAQQLYGFIGTRISEETAKSLMEDLQTKGEVIVHGDRSLAGPVSYRVKRLPKFVGDEQVRKIGQQNFAVVVGIREDSAAEPMYWIEYNRDFATREYVTESKLERAA